MCYYSRAYYEAYDGYDVRVTRAGLRYSDEFKARVTRMGMEGVSINMRLDGS